MKLIFNYILLVTVYCVSFSQNTIDLNTSKNKIFLANKSLNIKNLPAYTSISEFTMNEAIRNNEINIGYKIVFDLVNFKNIKAEVTYKSTDVNNVTSYICKFKEFQFSQAFIAVNKGEYSILIDIPEQRRKFKNFVSNDRVNNYLVELDTANLDDLQCNDLLLELIIDVHPIEEKLLPNQGAIPNINKKTPITDANIITAINTCLSTNPEDGMCSNSEYGAMSDWDVSQVTIMSHAFNGKTDFNGNISDWM